MNGFSSSASSPERQRLEKFYEDWIYHKSAKGKSWNKVWVVIRGHFMFAFKSRQTHRPDQLIGYLLLNYHTVCKNRGDDKPGRFKFDVHTIDRDGKMMHNRFRCETRPERDLWRGYIIGLATGRIPEDVPLTPSQLHAIASAMERLQANPNCRPSPGSVPPPIPNGNEFIGMEQGRNSGTMMLSNGVHSVSAASSASSSGGSGGHSSIPQIREHKHRFHEDDEINMEGAPCWFFEVCNRERAEQILEYGHSYGSVLMRESTTFRDSGSYTISMRNFPGSTTRFSHFQVMRVARGYKIQFDYEHEPLSCLSDIMAYFVSVSGTQPMRTNDIDLLLSATTKPGNGVVKNSLGANGNRCYNTANNNNGNVVNGCFNGTNGGGAGSNANNLSRKDSAMDIVNDAFQFLDNKSCISVNSNGNNPRGGGICCDCDGGDVDGCLDGDDACHYSVTGDDENGGHDSSGDGDVIENGNNHFSHTSNVINDNHTTNGHSRHPPQQQLNGNCAFSNNCNNNNNIRQQQPSAFQNGKVVNNNNNGRVHPQQQLFGDEPSPNVNGNNNCNGSGPFFQSELSARISRRKESVESDDTRCPSSYSSTGCNTNNIPLLSSTLQTRVVPPPPPPLPSSAIFCNGGEESNELYVNSDDVIAQTLSRNNNNGHQQPQQYARPQQQQPPRLPPRPTNFTFESCSAELIEKLQRRLSRIPDA